MNNINGNISQIAPVIGICSIILLGNYINLSIPVAPKPSHDPIHSYPSKSSKKKVRFDSE